MGRLFGTDGVRGVANRDITAELAVDLAVAAAHVQAMRGAYVGHRPRAVVGHDPRISSEFLTAAISAGLASAGVDVMQVGMLPTPGLAFLTQTMDVDLGVMLSASHNPMVDNGIKFFARGGYKLPDSVEDAIEARLGEGWERPTGADVGRIGLDWEAGDAYLDHLVAAAPARLEGLHVALDCAHGAASRVAPRAFSALGARVTVSAAHPDGCNINDGVGSTHPEALQALVTASHADVGFAFDGDADRCLAVDAHGELVDGDQIMGVLALALQARGELAHDTLVTTIMSNQGLHQAMHEAGIATVRTGVGDRYVLEEMLRGGYSLGGEQSGHVIIGSLATTGDGILTAIQVAGQVILAAESLASLARRIERLPQRLINVRGVDKSRATTDAGVIAAVEAAEHALAGAGRVLLRESGTEPVVRVMVEAATQEQADDIARALAVVVDERLAL